MMDSKSSPPLSGELLNNETKLSLSQLCQVSEVSETLVKQFVNEGIIDPEGNAPQNWYFQGVAVKRVLCVVRLVEDLGVNLSGAALAVDLIDEIDLLKTKINRLEVRVKRTDE